MELQVIQNKIYEVRGQKVMLDFDLAELYGTETKRLKEAVRRNLKRFPSDFMFELTKEEFERLRSQIASSNKRGGTRYMPFVSCHARHTKKSGESISTFSALVPRPGTKYRNHRQTRESNHLIIN